MAPFHLEVCDRVDLRRSIRGWTDVEFEKNMMFVMYKYRPDDLWGLLELRPHVRYQEYRDAKRRSVEFRDQCSQHKTTVDGLNEQLEAQLAERKARLGAAAAQPHRVKYRKLK